MKGAKKPVVKICCIGSIQEAKLALTHGASAIGLVGPMPSGPGIISDNLIKEIAATLPTEIASFLLTSETSAETIIAHQRKVGCNTIQMVDALVDDGYADIRTALPKVSLVQVIHVMDESSIDEAIRISKYVDYLLLDSGNPRLAIKQLGGTGKVHNWELSRRIRESIDIPLFLAGGLNHLNVELAIETVQPYGVDLCTGVRTHGHLDEQKLKQFFQAIDR